MATRNIAAGLLMCRFEGEQLQFFLVHPGGPFFKNKDEGVWSIPKGIPEPHENLLNVAIREFEEETGIKPSGDYYDIGNVRQKGGKIIHCWTFLGAWDSASGIKSNTFSMEWPPRSGTHQHFPEMDKAGWFSMEEAKSKINPAQIPLLERATGHFRSEASS